MSQKFWSGGKLVRGTTISGISVRADHFLVRPAPQANSTCYCLTRLIEWTTTLRWMATCSNVLYWLFCHSLHLPSIALLYRECIVRSVHCIAPRSVPLRPRENVSPPVFEIRKTSMIPYSMQAETGHRIDFTVSRQSPGVRGYCLIPLY